MEALKQRILEHIADLLDEPTFKLDMRLADCIDPLPIDKSELHLLMTDAAFKAFCTYFNKQDNTEQLCIGSVVKSFPSKEDIMSEGAKQINDWLEGNTEQEKQHYLIGFRRSYEYVLRRLK